MSETFKPIGEKVEQVAPVQQNANGAPEEEEERGVEEIESLCMNCGKNVS